MNIRVQKKPIFLVSSGRCGSTFFSDSINSHPKLVSISELFEPILPVAYLDNSSTITGAEFLDILTSPTMSERIDIWLSAKTKECLYLPEKRDDISLLLCYTLPLFTKEPEKFLVKLSKQIINVSPTSPANHFLHFCELIKENANKKIWIERSGGSLPHTKEILQCWPNAKIIHFFRDGRQTACSMRAHPIFRMFVMKRMGIEWNPDFIPPLEEFGYMWSQWVVDAVNVIDEFNAEVLPISYESLLIEPKKTLESFLKFTFEVDSLNKEDYDWIKYVQSNISPAKDHLTQISESQLEELEKSCYTGMKALGYKIDI